MNNRTNTKDKLLKIMQIDTSFGSWIQKQILANALSIDDLKDIQQVIENRRDLWSSFYILSKCIEDMQDKERWQRERFNACFNKNHDVNELLSWYKDKTSGKVLMARKELQKRFFYLSEEEQMTIMISLLSGGKKDREWCYNTLHKWWREDIKHIVIDVWNRYHEEHCGWVITKFCSTEEIRPIVDELSYESNYYYLCKRLFKKEWFHIDTKKLAKCCDNVKYIWIMSQTEEGIDEDKALQLLYCHIAKILAHMKESTDVSKAIYYNMHTRWNTDDEDYLYVHKLYNVEKILSSMCRMGYTDAVLSFISDDNWVHNKFLSERKGKYQGNPGKVKFADLVMDYITLFLSLAASDILTYQMEDGCDNFCSTEENGCFFQFSEDNPDPLFKDYDITAPPELFLDENDIPY